MKCAVCGREFVRRKWNQKYCTTTCANKAQKKIMQKVHNSRPNPPAICRICGSYADALATHLKYSHRITLEEYYEQYPAERGKVVDIWARTPFSFWEEVEGDV